MPLVWINAEVVPGFASPWQESWMVGTLTDGPDSLVLVCAHAREGRAYIELVQSERVPDGRWHVVGRVVLPASDVEAVKGLIERAASEGGRAAPPDLASGPGAS